MNKEKIIEVIKNNIIDNLEELEDIEIDPSKSMKEYGVNSLDIIEVVSTSMRELKIKIPRADLADIQTIDQLADKFMEHVQ